jgi:hypothetical protein
LTASYVAASVRPVRRQELERLGIQLPVLPTIALGGLPGPPEWGGRLDRLGLDVVASGAAVDTPATWFAARAAAPRRAVKAVGGDPAALAAAGCALIETAAEVPAGAYRLGPEESLVSAVDGRDPAVEDPSDVAAAVLVALGAAPPAALWACASPGLEAHPPQLVEAKLTALVEGVRLARLLLAKEQFERE